MRIGYERVSTENQSTLRQEDMMITQNLDTVYVEKVSGKDRNRPKLKKMLEDVQSGDVVIIESISRLSRSTRDFLNILDEFQKKDVTLISLKENLDTTTPTGRFMINIFASIAQLEREQLLLRQMEGIRAQKARGIYKGGRPRIKVDSVLLAVVRYRWMKKELSWLDAMDELGVTRSTFYRLMNRYTENKERKRNS